MAVSAAVEVEHAAAAVMAAAEAAVALLSVLYFLFSGAYTPYMSPMKKVTEKWGGGIHILPLESPLLLSYLPQHL